MPCISSILLSGPQERVPAGRVRRPPPLPHPTNRQALFSVYEECGGAPKDEEATTTIRAYCRQTATTMRTPATTHTTTEFVLDEYDIPGSYYYDKYQ